MSDSTESLPAAAREQASTFTRQQVDSFLDDQRLRSRRGESFLVETYLELQPGLSTDHEALLDLIYNEMLLREAAGEKPQLQEYVARFPHLAQELANQFEIEQALQDHSSPLTERLGGSTDKRSAVPPAQGLSGYEVLELLGEGGIGVVYKARQRSLNRIVALKMIQAGAQASQEDRRRFRLEAEAVARLQHPHLVHIFEVGESDGQPYLALEYVDGGNLSDRLDGKSWPAIAAAHLIEVLARAIHYAHSKGIVHRDLKPANILVTSGLLPEPRKSQDSKDTLTQDHWSLAATFKITDFGLAKFLTDDTKKLTETGSFLGTPSYTAPEQATGKIHEIGPGTDVYALGAILYELLTGRPPFEGPSVIQILEQVRSADPVLPSRHDTKLPRDLETICLKCLEKDPRRRYASALILAEDLQRFQAGQPILARPAGLIERVRKWIKRRPAVAALIAVVTAGLLTLAAMGWWTALTVNAARRQAEANLAQALEAVEYLLDEVGAVDLQDVPQMEPVRKKLLLKAKTFYDRFLDERADDPKLRFLAGRGFSRLGSILELLDENEAAEKAYGRAIDMLKEETDSVEQQERELGRTWNNLGVLLKKLGRTRAAEAESALRQALDIRQRLVERAAEERVYQQELAASHHDLGTVLARVPNQQAPAAAAYRAALRLQDNLVAASPLPEYLRDRARTLNNLGVLLQYTDVKEAEKCLQQAERANQELVAKGANAPGYRRELARTCNNLASLYTTMRTPAAAKKEYERSLSLLKELALDFPKVPVYREDLAAGYRNLGKLFENGNQYSAAEKAYAESLRLRLELSAEAPEVPDYQKGLAYTHMSIGNLMVLKKQARDAEVHFRRAVSVLEKIALAGARPVYHHDLAYACSQLAKQCYRHSQWHDLLQLLQVLAQSGNGTTWPVVAGAVQAHAVQAKVALAEAVSYSKRAVSCQRHACKADSANTAFQEGLANHCLNVIRMEVARRQHAQAALAAEEYVRVFPKRRDNLVEAAKLLALCVYLASSDTKLHAVDRKRSMDDYGTSAITLLRQAKNLGFDNIEALRKGYFAPLRDRADFMQLLEEMEKNAPRVG
jgi:tetratricopeptide (TPR) repeat protein